MGKTFKIGFAILFGMQLSTCFLNSQEPGTYKNAVRIRPACASFQFFDEEISHKKYSANFFHPLNLQFERNGRYFIARFCIQYFNKSLPAVSINEFDLENKVDIQHGLANFSLYYRLNPEKISRLLFLIGISSGSNGYYAMKSFQKSYSNKYNLTAYQITLFTLGVSGEIQYSFEKDWVFSTSSDFIPFAINAINYNSRVSPFSNNGTELLVMDKFYHYTHELSLKRSFGKFNLGLVYEVGFLSYEDFFKRKSKLQTFGTTLQYMF